MNKEETRICDLVRKNLGRFPLYSEEHKVSAKQHKNGVSISYRTTPANIPFKTTHFDMQIINTTCYVLQVEIIKEMRNRGYGELLYRILEDIARGCDCDRVHLTPSGQTSSGKTQLEYMKSLGYEEIETGEVEILLHA